MLMKCYRQIDPVTKIYLHSVFGAVSFITAIIATFLGLGFLPITVNFIAFLLNILLAFLLVKDLEINV